MGRSSSLKNSCSIFLLKAARLRFLRPLITFFFNHMEKFIPGERLYENAQWIAFKHPQPDYPLHILILPKRSIISLTKSPADPELYTQLFEVVKQLVADFGLEEHGYRLITNGGQNQTIPQWHWHLVSEHNGDLDA